MLSTTCPACGRRHRARRHRAPPDAPLLAMIERAIAAERARRTPRPAARLVLRADLRDAAGEPRPCLVEPGKPPRAYPTIQAALAALSGGAA
jgi:hypothetical protein